MGPTGKSTDMSGPYRSQTIAIGNLLLGGEQPVRVQSMTNTDTNDVKATVDQCIRMIGAGAEIIRLTTQGKREVANLKKIRDALRSAGFQTPLVADIHFKPDLALEAARVADKIRINPGNYLKGKPVEHLLPVLLETCRVHHTAIRIGVNHGSLAEHIVNRFGDTPAGMVESAMQFLRVCREQSFHQVVVSMKSSNPRVMIQSVRLLVRRMKKEGMAFPLHLGVTEAGDGPEGRIKSAVGLVPLLLEGYGDTIRVSLTEPPEMEMPVARSLLRLFPGRTQPAFEPPEKLAWDPYAYQRRESTPVMQLGNGSKVRIISQELPERDADLLPETILPHCVTYEQWQESPEILQPGRHVLLLEQGNHSILEIRSRLNSFCKSGRPVPVIFKTTHSIKDPELFRLRLAGELGSLLVEGAIDAVWVEHNNFTCAMINETVLMILQAAGARISKTEYIACPSCGRTQFDILSRLKEIRQATSHLTSLKIGVMGCIVNGPGEMADAHYGYVGSGPGRVSLYKGKKVMRKNLPEQEALPALITLLKQEGDWKEP